jgi:hypothetical protein
MKHILRPLAPTLLTSIDLSAVLAYLSFGWIQQRLDVPHVDHGLREVGEKGVLTPRKQVDDWRGDALRLRRRLELLVRVEEPSVHLQVVVVVLVKGVWRGWVKVVQNRAVAVPRASLGEERPVPGVQGRVRPVRAAEVVEPPCDELALHPAKSVRPCMFVQW